MKEKVQDLEEGEKILYTLLSPVSFPHSVSFYTLFHSLCRRTFFLKKKKELDA